MSQKFQSSVQHRSDVSYVKLGGVIDEDNELTDLVDKIPTGTAVIDLGEIERINSCGVRDWVNWLSKLENNGTRGSSDTGAISSGGGESSACGSHTAPGAGSLGFRNSPLARATGSPCCSTRVSTRQRRLPSRTIRLVSRHGCFRAGRNRSSE